jgi:cytochrome c
MRMFLFFILMCFETSLSFAAAIHDAAKTGDVAAITAELDAGADVNQSDGAATPLYSAVRRGHLAAAKLLIERGADVNAKTMFGSALLAAVAISEIELIHLLLEKGANPNAVFDGSAVLHVATRIACFDCVKVLIAAGADVNAQTHDAQTPLHLARRLGSRDIVDYLMAHGVVLPKPPPISAKLAAADVESGRKVFGDACSTCHSAELEKGRKSGPSLWGIAGRDKASYTDFVYSEALLDWEGVWTYEDLNIFLSAPRATTPGVNMDTAGVPDETDRANLIAYLRTLSDTPMPLP